MQTYANFTVGGSLSVNCHGRYVGLGSLILSVLSISVVLSNGDLVQATPEQNADIFYAAIGGYGAIGIIVEAELSLAENTKIERIEKKMKLSDYHSFFKDKVRNSKTAIFHNADMIPPKFSKTRAVTWVETNKAINTKSKKNRQFYFLEKYMLWAITETVMGHFRREYIYEPLIYLRPKISYRNDEANYDVAELEPVSRTKTTYVLQEYFVPVDKIEVFTPLLTEILNRFKVKIVNISIRHSYPDTETLLSWAPEEVFAFVLYYKQGTSKADSECVAVWTRELIDAALSCDGRYYLPYQPHARYQQFHQAYPNAEKLFKLKQKLDPNYQFKHCLWEKYYLTNGDLPLLSTKKDQSSEFLNVYGNISSRDNFYRFLQNIYRLYPEHEFHQLIIEACEKHNTDKDIYHYISEKLPNIKTRLSEITFALPSLKKQKKMITQQTIKILKNEKSFHGYLEIGSTGRYVKSLKKAIDIKGSIYLSNDIPPDNSPPEIAERGGIAYVGDFFPLNDYAPITKAQIEDESLDLVSCYIGLHHCPDEKLSNYISSISRIIRPGGYFILRDHNAESEDMKTFCSLVHTVFNAGLNTSWKENQQELRLFNSVNHWVKAITQHNFIDSDQRLLQSHDPSLNTLLCFKKT